MKIQCTWNEKMKFSAEAEGHHVMMDTKPPIGSGSALSPKQLLLAAVCGCTAMDVVALLKKHQQPLESLAIEADAPMTDDGYPVIFKELLLNFKLTGNIDPNRIMEAVTLSQSKYCGVSAMISKTVPIHFHVQLNGQEIGSGSANFEV